MLGNALDSIFSQSVQPANVYLVIDETDGENNYDFLHDYGPLLHVTFTGGGLGGGAARNVGLQQLGDEEYIFFLDDDDTWCPQKIEKQLKCMAAKPDGIGVTCWNYNIAQKTTEVKRVGEHDINRYVNVWNTLGSFSFVGYRLTCDTRRLRVSEELRAAQDWEFYMRLSRFGDFSVVEECLARYYEHDEARITGNACRKAKAWEWVYQQHYDQLRLRQRWLHLARINWKYSETKTSLATKCAYSLKAIMYSIISCHRIYTRKVAASSVSSVLRAMGLKQ